MMAFRCFSRLFTGVVAAGPRRAVGAVVCSGHGARRSFSTLGAWKAWLEGTLSCGGAGKALTLRGLPERSMKDPRIDRAVAVCKKVVSSFSFSWKRRRDLATAQQELNLPAHQLISESPTRWGSREEKIERVLEQKQTISQVLAADKKTRHLVLTWQDLEVLESVHKALKPLLEFTDALSGESYVTVSYVKPVLHLFQSSLLARQEDDTPLTQSIKASILDYLREKYSDPSTNDLLDMAGLVDPRFKIKYRAQLSWLLHCLKMQQRYHSQKSH